MKVVITGPESSGKSTLAECLGTELNITVVKEYAREYLELRDGNYEQVDLTEIAKGQIAAEDRALLAADGLVICDTSLEVIRIWSEWKYNTCDPFILDQGHKRQPDLYLLLKPDIPWKPDPLRENPEDRDEIFVCYQKLLASYSCPVTEISGDQSARLAQAMDAIDSLI